MVYELFTNGNFKIRLTDKVVQFGVRYEGTGDNHIFLNFPVTDLETVISLLEEVSICYYQKQELKEDEME